jgi:hypothetical protein
VWPYFLPADGADEVRRCILSLLWLLDGLLLLGSLCVYVCLLGPGGMVLWRQGGCLTRRNCMKLALKLPAHLKQSGDILYISSFVDEILPASLRVC